MCGSDLIQVVSPCPQRLVGHKGENALHDTIDISPETDTFDILQAELLPELPVRDDELDELGPAQFIFF